MKRTFNAPIRNVAALMLVVATIAISSCKKETTSPADTTGTVTEEEQVEVITDAVATTSGGATLQVTQATTMVPTYIGYCGITKDSAISKASLADAAVTYSVNSSWSWTITCTPTPRFDFTYTGAVVYDAPHMSSNDSLYATLGATGFTNADSAYHVDINITRKGSQVSKIRSKSTFSSLVTITGTNLTVNKTTNNISSGTASVSISGTSSKGNSFSLSGTLVFTGYGSGTLTLKSGTVYNLTW